MSRENIKLLLVAACCITVAWTGPAVAHGVNHALFAHNADKVDGKHAVSSTASASERTGKLVATGSTGLLPNNIIAKALDADKLDGLDSTDLSKKAELEGPGSFNDPTNPVNWTKLKNVPTGLNDGDAGQGMWSATQFTGSLTAHETKTWFSHSWPKNYTVIWQAVPTTSGGKVSTSVVAVENSGSTFTYHVTVKNELGTAVNFEARYTAIPRS